jgi:hypothetical protein
MSTLKEYTDFESRAVLRQKTGKKDPTSDWAVARLTIAQQMIEQLQLGMQLDSNEITYHDAYKNPDAPPPIFPDAVLHVDENHTVASLGGAGHNGSFANKQYFVAVDKSTGALLRKSEGGVVPQRRFRVVAKYTTEARGAYGVCCPTINGQEKPQFMKTWDYTGKMLVSYKVWKQEERREMAYRRTSNYGGWKAYKGENPYEERYGDNWEEELAKAPKMKTKISGGQQTLDLLNVLS